MTTDSEQLRSWIGRSETARDTIGVTPVVALAATLGHPPRPVGAGTPLPPLWHWLYFLPVHRQSEIGADGHAKRGGFLPPEPSSADDGELEDDTRADAIPFSAIPSALQALDLQPDDEDVLAVFRNAATGWENKGGSEDDAHLLVGRKDWRAVCAALLDVGDGHVELLSPLSPETPVGKFLERRGPGLHHVAYRVASVQETLAACQSAGLSPACT